VKSFTHEFGCISVVAPYTWIDSTKNIEADNAPFTLSKKDVGVGALQFSIALYTGGDEPNITLPDLKRLLAEFADDKSLGEGFDEEVHENRLSFVAASYSWGTDLLRAWYCSDERNVAFITYVCDWEKKGEEVNECGEIIKSLRFNEAEGTLYSSKR
jgi:hypothetical protein